jgi:hypothetical protein
MIYRRGVRTACSCVASPHLYLCIRPVSQQTVYNFCISIDGCRVQSIDNKRPLLSEWRVKGEGRRKRNG